MFPLPEYVVLPSFCCSTCHTELGGRTWPVTAGRQQGRHAPSQRVHPPSRNPNPYPEDGLVRQGGGFGGV